MTRKKLKPDHYANVVLFRYYEFVKSNNRLSELCDYLGFKSSASLTNILNLRASLPLETAVKIVAFSNYEIYLGDIAPYMKEYLPHLARQQFKKENLQCPTEH